MIEKVVPNPHQPRKVIDPEAVSELASSIASEGLLQPIVVRPVDNGYELIAENAAGGLINILVVLLFWQGCLKQPIFPLPVFL